MLKATRPFAAPTKIRFNGKLVEFIDGWHAKLFQYGLHLEARGTNKRMRDPLWYHFARFVEDDPQACQPFSKPHHVDMLAMHLVCDIEADNWGRDAHFITPDGQFDYFQRNIRDLCAEFLGD